MKFTIALLLALSSFCVAKECKTVYKMAADGTLLVDDEELIDSSFILQLIKLGTDEVIAEITITVVEIM